MSALAKAFMAFHEKHCIASHGGAVWVPENVWEKFVELARRERPRAAFTPDDTRGQDFTCACGASFSCSEALDSHRDLYCEEVPA